MLFLLEDYSRHRACRTLLCKSKRGGLKDTYPDEILAPVLQKTNLNLAEVGDIVVGYVLGSGSQRARECIMAAFYAGFPGLRTVNRQHSSVLQAVADVAASIKPGFYDIGIGAGLESMTAYPMAWDGSVNPRRFGMMRKEQD
ncbi:3-ketoacyl-CoA thiolase 2, peroxisomal [Tanacetum coccineum]